MPNILAVIGFPPPASGGMPVNAFGVLTASSLLEGDMNSIYASRPNRTTLPIKALTHLYNYKLNT